MPWWVWLLAAVSIAALITGWAFRTQLRFAMKVAKALATDSRLPKPLRWTMGIALAVKVVPFPDFGTDETLLTLSALLLLTVYRPTFLVILAETREAETRTRTRQRPNRCRGNLARQR